MSQRILKNNTLSPVTINDVGQTVPAAGNLVINPTDYGKYEGSSDVIGYIGSLTLTVNDGSFDLSVTDGTRLIQGGFYLPISDGADPTIKASVIQTALKNYLAVSGFMQQSGLFNITNISGVISLPTGAATAANQATEIASLASIDGKLNSLGQKPMSGSVPVTMASDQTSIGVSGIAGQWPLPTGASTAANQATEIASLASIDSKLNTLGQKAMAGSVPVTMATDQTPIGVSGIAGQWPLPSGASTSANQTTEIAVLTAISGFENAINNKLVDGYGSAAAALRTASQIGNTAGQADFDAGSVGPQTLRVGAAQLGVWNINNVSGVVSLPTGAATAALQTSGNASLTSIDSKLTAPLVVLPKDAVSTNNSSTTNLASAATFTGTADNVSGFSSLSVTFKTDQNVTIQVQQSNDSTNWDIVDSYTVVANTADSRSFGAFASFARVLVTNNGGSTTTFFRLQTILSSFEDVLPRSLTNGGQLRNADVFDLNYLSGVIAVGSVTPVEAKIGTTRLPKRKALTMTPLTGDIARGSTNTVTAATGTPVVKKQFAAIGATDNIAVWLIASSGTVNVALEEFA